MSLIQRVEELPEDLKKKIVPIADAHVLFEQALRHDMEREDAQEGITVSNVYEAILGVGGTPEGADAAILSYLSPTLHETPTAVHSLEDIARLLQQRITDGIAELLEKTPAPYSAEHSIVGLKHAEFITYHIKTTAPLNNAGHQRVEINANKKAGASYRTIFAIQVTYAKEKNAQPSEKTAEKLKDRLQLAWRVLRHGSNAVPPLLVNTENRDQQYHLIDSGYIRHTGQGCGLAEGINEITGAAGASFTEKEAFYALAKLVPAMLTSYRGTLRELREIT